LTTPEAATSLGHLSFPEACDGSSLGRDWRTVVFRVASSQIQT
jgi:hypothetical protein